MGECAQATEKIQVRTEGVHARAIMEMPEVGRARLGQVGAGRGRSQVLKMGSGDRKIESTHMRKKNKTVKKHDPSTAMYSSTSMVGSEHTPSAPTIE